VEHGPTQWPAADSIYLSDAVVAFDLDLDLGLPDAAVALDEPLEEAPVEPVAVDQSAAEEEETS